MGRATISSMDPMHSSTPPRSARRVRGGRWDAGIPAELDGFERLGVDDSFVERGLRLLRDGEEGSSDAGSREGGRADVDATGEPGVGTGSDWRGGVVESGEGALREMLFVRRYMPDNCRLSRRRGWKRGWVSSCVGLTTV